MKREVRKNIVNRRSIYIIIWHMNVCARYHTWTIWLNLVWPYAHIFTNTRTFTDHSFVRANGFKHKHTHVSLTQNLNLKYCSHCCWLMLYVYWLCILRWETQRITLSSNYFYVCQSDNPNAKNKMFYFTAVVNHLQPNCDLSFSVSFPFCFSACD